MKVPLEVACALIDGTMLPESWFCPNCNQAANNHDDVACNFRYYPEVEGGFKLKGGR